MSLMDIFRKEQQDTKSASVAKERLRVLVAHDRLRHNGPEYLPQLQQEILAVIRKYVAIEENDVNVQLEQQGQTSVLELNVTLPEDD
ncbi:cell division topological specificity factor MinE [Bacterioplanoides pacificum]|uniref:Cell division topological specificity factor n=1 Tax=Bacterioplanoides pacificum TaxID=1171596 RepID=A0ABV7VNX9_9GAMM